MQPSAAPAAPAPSAPRAPTPTPTAGRVPPRVPPPPVAPSASAPVPARTPTAPESSIDSTTARRYPALPSTPVAVPALPIAQANLDAPAILPYRQGLPVPVGYRVEHRAASGLIVGGLATLIVSYGAALGVAVDEHFKNGTGWTALPVLGPWAAIGARSFHCTSDPLAANACVNSAFSEVQTIAILSADAVVQATGAVLFLAGLGSGSDELVRSDLQAHVRVTPRTFGANSFGIGVDGRF